MRSRLQVQQFVGYHAAGGCRWSGPPGPSQVLFPRAEAKGEAGSAGKDAVAMPLSCCVPVCQPGLSVSAGGVGRSCSTLPMAASVPLHRASALHVY